MDKITTVYRIAEEIKTKRPELDRVRIDKAVDLVINSRLITGDPWTWTIVRGWSDREYDVMLWGKGESTCTCPDHTINKNVCKHIIAAHIYRTYLKRITDADKIRMSKINPSEHIKAMGF